MDLGFNTAFFNPAKHGEVDDELQLVTVHGTDGQPSYVYNRSIILAINLARATRRPLFIAGRPGTGKTTLAANVARVLGWKYYQRTVTSRTRAKDLQWSFDSLRRLSDAQEKGRKLPPRATYIQPQEFWWAFSRETARHRGASGAARKAIKEAKDLARFAPPRSNDSTPAVLLIDEIDKADPDVPNDLLEVLDVGTFEVDELDEPIRVRADLDRVLLMITSNGERELPPAFLRRCVVLHLKEPTPEWLVQVANDRFGDTDQAFHREVAEKVMTLREAAKERDLREPSTAEYLDAVAACRRLGIDAKGTAWQLVAGALLAKRAPADEEEPNA